MMNNKNQEVAMFVSFCIEQYKNAKHITGEEAVKLLDKDTKSPMRQKLYNWLSGSVQKCLDYAEDEPVRFVQAEAQHERA